MIFFQLLILGLLIYIILLLSYSLLRGAPYAALSHNRISTMLKLLNTEGGKFSDIGSGDGRIVIAAAKQGVDAYGYEINPLLFLISKNKIRKDKLSNAKIYLKDYWRSDFSVYNYVTVWGIPHMMKPLEKKLLLELKPGAKVVSNHFRFPNWKYEKKENDIYLYIK